MDQSQAADKAPSQGQEPAPKVIQSFSPQYIIGQTTHKQILNSSILFSDEQTGQALYFNEYEITTYLAKSQPTGTTNLVFPKQVLDENQNVNVDILDPDCELAKLINFPNKSEELPKI